MVMAVAIQKDISGIGSAKLKSALEPDDNKLSNFFGIS